MSVGLEAAGHTTIAFAEKDAYARQVLELRFPDVPIYEDVDDVRATDLPRVDIVTGGFPCQPVSVAGNQQGEDDHRWLWPNMLRVIRETHPRWVLVENVVGLLSVDAGRLFGTVVGDLAALGMDLRWDCIPAAAVGAPHIRDRVWILAHSPEQGRGLEGSAAPSRTQGAGAQCEPRGSGDVPDTDSSVRDGAERTAGRRLELQAGGQAEPAHDGAAQPMAAHASLLSDTGRELLEGWIRESAQEPTQWSTEPDVGRVADGVPSRVDRLRCLGNALVPTIAFIYGRVMQ